MPAARQAAARFNLQFEKDASTLRRLLPGRRRASFLLSVSRKI
jgi:hypothetical protein